MNKTYNVLKLLIGLTFKDDLEKQYKKVESSD